MRQPLHACDFKLRAGPTNRRNRLSPGRLAIIVRAVSREPSSESARVLPRDLDSPSGQHTIFTVLNLFLLVALWAAHTSFAEFWGKPSGSLLGLLGGCFVLRCGELLWLRRHTLGSKASAVLTCCSIAFNLVLALVLASIVDREDSQYSALLAVPILESAFQFGPAATLAVAALAD